MKTSESSEVADGRMADSPDAAPGSAQGGALYDPTHLELARVDLERIRLRNVLHEALTLARKVDVGGG